jgi:disulfide bond formation protein DsbB
MHNRTLFVVLMLSFVFILAACGGKDEPEAAGNSAAAAAANDAQPAAVEGDPAHGEELYMASCVACHGPDAKGMPSLGKSLHPSDSEFVKAKSNTELVEFIKVGRQPDDPLNTTGVAMPPKGGNPAISDADLYDVVAWIRTLQ